MVMFIRPSDLFLGGQKKKKGKEERGKRKEERGKRKEERKRFKKVFEKRIGCCRRDF